MFWAANLVGRNILDRLLHIDPSVRDHMERSDQPEFLHHLIRGILSVNR